MTLRPYRPNFPFFYRELGIRWSSSGYPCQVVFLSFQTSTYRPLPTPLFPVLSTSFLPDYGASRRSPLSRWPTVRARCPFSRVCSSSSPSLNLAQAEGCPSRGGQSFGRAVLSLARVRPHLLHCSLRSGSPRFGIWP